MSLNLFLGGLLFFAVLFALLVLYQFIRSNPTTATPLFLFVTWVVRFRFALFTIFAPILLGAMAFWDENNLLAVLLAREQSLFFVFDRDIWLITWMSHFTVGLGIMIARVVWQNASERLDGESNIYLTPRLGWPLWLLFRWWAFSLALPIACVFKTIADIPNDAQGEMAWLACRLTLGIVLGWAFANAAVFLIACLQHWTLGAIDTISRSGFLPYERLVLSLGIKPWTILHRQVPGSRTFTWLFGQAGTGFSWLLQGPGYTDSKTNVLLPGQAQIIITAMVSFVVYVLQYFYDLTFATWNDLFFPTTFFALLVLFNLGWLLSGVAFWLDRYRIPTLLMVVLWLFSIYGVIKIDHSFDLNHRLDASDKTSHKDNQEQQNVYLKALSLRIDGKTPEQPFFGKVLQQWQFPKDKQGKRTLVVVATSGGGIQAAAWTATVLTELDHKYPGFSQSVGLISSVSGGSVGTMYYLGLRGLRNPNEENRHSFIRDDAMRETIRKMSSESSLEACIWGLAFPDLVRTVVPLASPKLFDRGLALEKVWWTRMADERFHHAMSDVTIRDLIPMVEAGLAPAVIFNSTCVETGQRVSLSPICLAVSSESEKTDENTFVQQPIDFLKFYDTALDGAKADLRVSTAVRLSATFSYLSPVAKPYLDAKWKWHEAFEKKRKNLHFCDGGYADNAGLVTVVEMVHDLMKFYRDPKTSRSFDRILIVRIEPFPPSAATVAQGNKGFQSAFLGPVLALQAARVSTQAERGELEMRMLQELSNPFKKTLDWVTHCEKLLAANVLDLQAADPAAAKKLEHVGNLMMDVGKKPFAFGIKQQATHIQDKCQTAFDNLKQVQEEAGPELRKRLEPAFKTLKKGLEEAKQAKNSVAGMDESQFILVDSVTFRFDPEKIKSQPDYQPPLSWTLSRKQKQAIREAWESEIARPTVNNTLFADSILPQDLSKFFPK